MDFPLPLPLPLALLLLGLVSGVHCVGMCGGIVGAFSAQPLIRRSELWQAAWRRESAAAFFASEWRT